MFIYKYIKYKSIANKLVSLKYNIYILKKYADIYSITFFSLNGILIWLNILHINIILVKHSFLILLNNLEYLILLNWYDNIIFKKWEFREKEEREGEKGRRKEEGGRFCGKRKLGGERKRGERSEIERKRPWGGRDIEGEFGKRSINGEREEEGTVLKNRN